MATLSPPLHRAAVPAPAPSLPPARPFFPATRRVAPPAGAAGHDFAAISVSAPDGAPGAVIQLKNGKGKKKGGGKKPPQNPYADASNVVGGYKMDETWQAWLRVGQASGHPAPNLPGHLSKPGESGKAQRERLKLITGHLNGWKDGLMDHLQATHGITDQKDLRLGKLRTRFNV